MKVLHFSSAKSWRGGEQQIAYLTTEFQQLQIEQLVLCVANSPLAAFCQRQEIPFQTYKKCVTYPLLVIYILLVQ